MLAVPALSNGMLTNRDPVPFSITVVSRDTLPAPLYQYIQEAVLSCEPSVELSKPSVQSLVGDVCARLVKLPEKNAVKAAITTNIQLEVGWPKRILSVCCIFIGFWV
jgi:hypothetical protein